MGLDDPRVLRAEILFLLSQIWQFILRGRIDYFNSVEASSGESRCRGPLTAPEDGVRGYAEAKWSCGRPHSDVGIRGF